MFMYVHLIAKEVGSLSVMSMVRGAGCSGRIATVHGTQNFDSQEGEDTLRLIWVLKTLSFHLAVAQAAALARTPWPLAPSSTCLRITLSFPSFCHSLRTEFNFHVFEETNFSPFYRRTEKGREIQDKKKKERSEKQVSRKLPKDFSQIISRSLACRKTFPTPLFQTEINLLLSEPGGLDTGRNSFIETHGVSGFSFFLKY